MIDLSDLIEKVERAEEGSAEIDGRIWCALNGKRFQSACKSTYGDIQVEFTEPPKRTWRCTHIDLVQNVSTSLDAITKLISKELPGWWWTTGDCSITSHASIAPDRNGEEAKLLFKKEFDEGFHADISQPTTPALALCVAFLRAQQARCKEKD